RIGVMCNSVTPGAAVGDGTTAFFRSNRPVRTTVMDMLWSGWGDPARATPLPDSVTGLLRDLLGVKPRPQEPLALEDLRGRPSPRARAAPAGGAAGVGGGQARADPAARIRPTGGRATRDLLGMREGDLCDVPAPVLLPAEHAAVLAVMAAGAEPGPALVPF